MITAVNQNNQEDDNDMVDDDDESRHTTKPPPLKSQLCITLSTCKLLDADLTTKMSYQYHPSAQEQSQASPTRTQSSSPRSSDKKHHDRAAASPATRSARNRGRKSRRIKKKDVEDAKNVLY
eukprot:CAMPEP_0114443450 /NCGR_PEP_ID=MMETSP0103-20121206/17531_1 /TAXON_ID=37642 ORGANISM="Paraphysomonas imperforata, Strain PA2" /NCGR_SAMPLE_ID=MMETSP0103 /ASSEMBLY_ACC=CAM_ASM_000201 /LENGTH=121 /DNA_ID=CAMNT_0001614865 /DNA_START=314 /DNA_END=679 /DNA_ORIENTATION=-